MIFKTISIPLRERFLVKTPLVLSPRPLQGARAARLRDILGAAALRNFIIGFFVGAFIGLLVSVISPSKRGGATDVLLGIIGAFLGTIYLQYIRGGVVTKIENSGLILAQIIGALILILIGRLLTNDEQSHSK